MKTTQVNQVGQTVVNVDGVTAPRTASEHDVRLFQHALKAEGKLEDVLNPFPQPGKSNLAMPFSSGLGSSELVVTHGSGQSLLAKDSNTFSTSEANGNLPSLSLAQTKGGSSVMTSKEADATPPQGVQQEVTMTKSASAQTGLAQAPNLVGQGDEKSIQFAVQSAQQDREITKSVIAQASLVQGLQKQPSLVVADTQLTASPHAVLTNAPNMDKQVDRQADRQSGWHQAESTYPNSAQVAEVVTKPVLDEEPLGQVPQQQQNPMMKDVKLSGGEESALVTAPISPQQVEFKAAHPKSTEIPSLAQLQGNQVKRYTTAESEHALTSGLANHADSSEIEPLLGSKKVANTANIDGPVTPVKIGDPLVNKGVPASQAEKALGSSQSQNTALNPNGEASQGLVQNPAQSPIQSQSLNLNPIPSRGEQAQGLSPTQSMTNAGLSNLPSLDRYELARNPMGSEVLTKLEPTMARELFSTRQENENLALPKSMEGLIQAKAALLPTPDVLFQQLVSQPRGDLSLQALSAQMVASLDLAQAKQGEQMTVRLAHPAFAGAEVSFKLENATFQLTFIAKDNDVAQMAQLFLPELKQLMEEKFPQLRHAYQLQEHTDKQHSAQQDQQRQQQPTEDTDEEELG